MGLGDTLQLLKDIKNGLEVNAAALALAGSRNAAGTRISRIDTPVTVNSIGFGGKIIYQDDFEGSAMNWTSGGANAGANNATRYTTAGARIYRGVASMLIETTATTPVAGHVASATRDIVLGKSTRSEMSCFFRADSDATNAYIMWQFTILPGNASVYYPQVRYSSADSQVQYTTNGTDWTSIISVNPDLSRWHYFSMAWDLTTFNYIKVQLDNNVWDGRSTALRTGASAAETRAAILIQIENATTTQSQMNIDDLMILDITESV